MKDIVALLKDTSIQESPICVITFAGFEDRVTQSSYTLKNWYSKPIDLTIVIDFENTDLNEPNRSIFIRNVKLYSSNNKIVSMDTFLTDFNSLVDQDKFTFYFDISGATREHIFKVLNLLTESNCNYNIIYTEAENYYPHKELYKKLNKKPINLISTLDDEIENKDVIYSKHCTIISPQGFTGTIDHGRMSLLIGFLTFKRSRLKYILDEIDFPMKILIVGKPNRADLQWRKDILLSINSDNVTHATEPIIELDTLSPIDTFSTLIDITFHNDRYFKYNIYLAPLGSKMQTIGAFFFWSYFKSTAIIFSKPEKYFPETFSKGTKDTFIIYKNTMLEATSLKLKNFFNRTLNSTLPISLDIAGIRF